MSGDLDRMEWQNGSMSDLDEDFYPEEVDGCLHGVPWCCECEECNEEDDDGD